MQSSVNDGLSPSSHHVTQSQLTDIDTVSHQHDGKTLKLGTWNVRGCNDLKKREGIDNLLHSLNLDFVAIQETKPRDNPYLNNGIEKIGICIPKVEFIQKVSEMCEFPIALTSANRSIID
ncbi:hypothetical protein HA402_008465 [Bradysia odoriphaga]|nr:hypothetical protein HA402_008465 [Bradysia odoriphaga]